MSRNIILLIAVLFVVTACSTTKDDAAVTDMTMEERNDITGGPLDGPGIDGQYVDQSALNGAAPGTQQDLAINVGDRVFYGYDSYELSYEAQQVLQAQAEWLKRYPYVSVTVEGHCDERGTREYNLALGEKRANAVKNYLSALGVENSRLSTISYGKERPEVIGTDPASHAQNRRGVTVVN